MPYSDALSDARKGVDMMVVEAGGANQTPHWRPESILRCAVTCGLYPSVGEQSVLSYEEFSTIVMSKFVLINFKTLESRQHLDMCDLAYDAYLYHHENKPESNRLGLVKALLQCDKSEVTSVLKNVGWTG